MRPLVIVMIIFLVACSKKPDPIQANRYSMSKAQVAGWNADLGEELRKKERIILLNAEIGLKVDNKDSASKKIIGLTKKYKGYVVKSGNTHITIRIKSNQFDSAIIDLKGMGDVTRNSIYGEDVTDKYYDSKIRLENKLKARERYLQLLESAENVEATLKVERELERLNEEIESLKGQMKRIEQSASYSKISISLVEKEKLGPVGFVIYWTFKGIGWLFVR